MSFDAAFELLMINEGGNLPNGGFTDDPFDSGKATKFGIAQASHPDVDVPNLTREEAKATYEKDYWARFSCDKMPWAIGWVFFDSIVNHGALEPTRWLQACVNVQADGVMGKDTMKGVFKAKTPLDVARDITLMRRDFCEQLHNWDRFKAGWCKRHLDTLIAAVNTPQDTTNPQT